MFHDQIDLKEGADITSEDWVIAVIKLKDSELHILTCPKCKEMSITDIYNGFRKMILSGQNPKFN
jgi:hypothetical protein